MTKTTINYYELLSKLREYEYKILSVNQQELTTWDIDILLLQAKAFIFGNEILKDEFKKKHKEFLGTTQTDSYKIRYRKAHEEIKKLAISRAKKQQRKLTYFGAYKKENFFSPFNAKVSASDDTRFFIDIPEDYYYPSLLSDTAELTGIFPNKKDCNNLMITKSLESFYYHIDKNIAAIKLFPIDFAQPKTKKDFINNQEKIEETLFIIPDDLEFFISSGDIKCDFFTDFFKLCFFATSICYVLNYLQNHIQNLIYENEYKNSDMPESVIKKNVLNYNKENDTFYINDKEFILTDAEKETLKELLKPAKEKEYSKKRAHARNVTNINDKFKKFIGQKPISSQRKKFYEIDENIIRTNY